MPNQIIASPVWSDWGTTNSLVSEGVGFDTGVSWVKFGLHPTWKPLASPASATFDFKNQLAGPVNFMGLAGLNPESAHRNMLGRSHNIGDWTESFPSFSDLALSTVSVGPFGGVEDVWLFEVNSTVHSSSFKSVRRKIENRNSLSAELTLSVYIKDATTNAKLEIRDGANKAYARYDVSTGVIINSGTEGSGFTFGNATITSAANGWYLCTLTGTTNTAALVEAVIGLLDSSDTDGTDNTDAGLGIYIFAAQVEVGDTATTDRHLVFENGQTEDFPAACFRFRMGVDGTYSAWTFDSGLQMVAQDPYDFRAWEKIHVPYLTGLTTERYLYAQLDIIDEFAITINMGRFVLANAWIAPLIVKGDVHMLSFSEERNIQHSGSGIPFADAEPKKRAAAYPLTVQSMSDAFNRYDALSKASTREVFFVLNDTAGRMQRESMFALSTWSPLIRSGNLWKGGISLLEF